jgi:cytochrome c553
LVMNGDPARQVTACVQCHGMAMTGVLPQVPGLLGLPRDYLNAQLGAWKAGKRRAHAPDCMAHVVERLSLADINAASTWLAAQAVPTNSAPALTAPSLNTNVAVPTCGGVALPQPTRGAL